MSNSMQVVNDTLARETDIDTDEGHKYVTFMVAKEAFATEMAPVQEIIRMPSIFPVPMAPAAMLGLSNLRGQVLPVISLRRLLGIEQTEHNDATRVVVIDIGQLVGFVVDQVASVVNIAPGAIESTDGLKGSVREDVLTGVLKNIGNHEMVMVLDFKRLVAAEFASLASEVRQHRTAVAAQMTDQSETEEDEADQLQMVSFTVNGEEYGVDIEQVQEIVQIPEHVVEVPHSPSHLMGLMNLRGRMLPLMVLRRMFSLSDQPLDERSRVVVIGIGGLSAGLVVDGVSEVLRVPSSIMEPLPSLLARNFRNGEIQELCRLDDGKRVVSIIRADSLLERTRELEINQPALAAQEESDEDAMNTDESSDDDLQIVVFHLADSEFGVEIDAVQEIVRVPESLTRVPKTPHFIEGMMNLRGSVLPVIDQRRQLDMQACERGDRQRVMVFDIRGVRTGFIVDAVTEVLKVAQNAITASPDMSETQKRVLGRVANLTSQKRMIQLINPKELISSNDAEQLSETLSL